VNMPWVKSSFSFANGNCVEVAELPGDSVGIRDSRDPDAAEKGVPLIRREPQDGPRGVSAVPNADLASRQARYLDAVTVGVAQRALDPVRA